MRVVLIGINHRTAPVELRERFAMPQGPGEQLAALQKQFPNAEGVILSTCNRAEYYIAKPSQDAPSIQDLRQFIAEQSGVSLELVTASSIHREQDQAIAHLFRVCCGLDSLVLGETQILGQVRRAYEAATDSGATGPVLHRVFQQAIASARHARRANGIDTGRVSVGSVAADLARHVFAGFDDKTILGIGAGEVAKVTLRHMLELKPNHLWLVNRTLDRADELAQRLGLTQPGSGVRPWDAMDELLVEADIVVLSTAASEPILTPDRLKPIIKKRRRRPLCLIDLAVPRDIDPAVASLTNVYLYNIDDLQSVVQQSVGERTEQARACETHINHAAAACFNQINHQDIGRLIRQLRTKLHDIGAVEQQRTLGKLTNPYDSDAVEAALNEHTHRLINKVLHMPLSQLDQRDTEAPLGFYAAALRRLFNLEDDPKDTATPPNADTSADTSDEPTRQAERVSNRP